MRDVVIVGVSTPNPYHPRCCSKLKKSPPFLAEKHEVPFSETVKHCRGHLFFHGVPSCKTKISSVSQDRTPALRWKGPFRKPNALNHTTHPVLWAVSNHLRERRSGTIYYRVPCGDARWKVSKECGELGLAEYLLTADEVLAFLQEAKKKPLALARPLKKEGGTCDITQHFNNRDIGTKGAESRGGSRRSPKQKDTVRHLGRRLPFNMSFAQEKKACELPQQ